MEVKRYEKRTVCGSLLLRCLCVNKMRKFILQYCVRLVILGKPKDNSDCTAACEACPFVRKVEERGSAVRPEFRHVYCARNVPKGDSVLER